MKKGRYFAYPPSFFNESRFDDPIAQRRPFPWIKKLVEKAKEAQSAKELSIAAKEAGITLSDPVAEKMFNDLHSDERELSDTELDNVAGGGCGDDPK